MHSNNTSANQLRSEHSIVKTHSLKESIMSFTKAAGNNVTRAAWMMLAVASITMVASTTQAAESGDSAPQKVVSYRDLNLTNSDGVAVLYRRIKGAANEVCGNAEQIRELARVAAANACVDKATSQAIAAVNSPMLTSLFLSKTGKTEKQLMTIAQLH
jgi:UrcA family protein